MFKQLYSKHAAQFHVCKSILQNIPCFIEVLLRKCLTHTQRAPRMQKERRQPLRPGKYFGKRASAATDEHHPPIQEKYILTSSKSKHLWFKVQKSAFTKQHAFGSDCL